MKKKCVCVGDRDRKTQRERKREYNCHSECKPVVVLRWWSQQVSTASSVQRSFLTAHLTDQYPLSFLL